MGYDVYVDGECADRLGSASAWDDAAITPNFSQKYFLHRIYRHLCHLF